MLLIVAQMMMMMIIIMQKDRFLHFFKFFFLSSPIGVTCYRKLRNFSLETLLMLCRMKHQIKFTCWKLHAVLQETEYSSVVALALICVTSSDRSGHSFASCSQVLAVDIRGVYACVFLYTNISCCQRNRSAVLKSS